MSARAWDLETARDETIASAAGGAPFLIAFGLTLFATAIASYFIPRNVAAIVVLFQGNLALPLAFWLERRLGRGRMSADNPLRSLSILMAFTQIVALPAVFLVYSLQLAYVPVAMAAIGGGHFLPYAWLHRTRLYTVLGVAVAVGAYALALALGKASFPWVLYYMAILYWAAVPLLIAHSRRVANAVARGTA